MLTYNEYVKVGIADYKITTSPGGLLTLGLGSCVGVCIYDIDTRIGGLAHIMLPTESAFKGNSGVSLKYADVAIPKMVDEMLLMGCQKRNLRAVVVGGGNMFINSTTPLEQSIGFRNQESVKSILSSLAIPIVAEDIGGNMGKTVYFDLNDGDVYVKKGMEIEQLYNGLKIR